MHLMPRLPLSGLGLAAFNKLLLRVTDTLSVPGTVSIVRRSGPVQQLHYFTYDGLLISPKL